MSENEARPFENLSVVLLGGMIYLAAVEQGLDWGVLPDEVMFGQEHLDYRALLARHDLRFVGLFAPLDVLESRERRRGDRELGLARWQYGRVHQGVEYDLRIDTAEASPAENARRVCEAFDIAMAA